METLESRWQPFRSSRCYQCRSPSQERFHPLPDLSPALDTVLPVLVVPAIDHRLVIFSGCDNVQQQELNYTLSLNLWNCWFVANQQLDVEPHRSLFWIHRFLLRTDDSRQRWVFCRRSCSSTAACRGTPLECRSAPVSVATVPCRTSVHTSRGWVDSIRGCSNILPTIRHRRTEHKRQSCFSYHGAQWSRRIAAMEQLRSTEATSAATTATAE